MRSATSLNFPAVAKAKSKNYNADSKFVYSIFGFIGVMGGILASFFGFALIAINAALVTDTILNQVGSGLMIISIPMILIGAVFMDKSEEKK